eukprot:scaffold140006_cov39-Cyclotella_meneghiniana.AAC.5
MDADSDNDGRGEVSRRQHYDWMSGDEFCGLGLNCFQLTWWFVDGRTGRSEFFVSERTESNLPRVKLHLFSP